MREKPLWLMLVLAVLVGSCVGAALFLGWFNFRPGNDTPVVIEPTVAIAEVENEREVPAVDLATALPEPTAVANVQPTSVSQPATATVLESTALPQPTQTAVSQSPTAVPIIIPPTEVPQTESSAPSNDSPTTQSVSFAEPEFAEFISQQAGTLGLDLTDTEASFASGQGTITGSLNTFGLRMGTELSFTLVAEDGEPQLTVTDGTIGSQPMPRQIIDQIETAFEQGVKAGLQTDGEVYIESIQMDNGLITVTYSQ